MFQRSVTPKCKLSWKKIEKHNINLKNSLELIFGNIKAYGTRMKILLKAE